MFIKRCQWWGTIGSNGRACWKMITSTANPISPAEVVESGGSVLLTDVSWEMYEKILDAFGERRLRHTYADGMLEIISPLHIHEWRKKFIGRMIEMMAWRLRIPIKSAGST